jgi:hypothetical protein
MSTVIDLAAFRKDPEAAAPAEPVPPAAYRPPPAVTVRRYAHHVNHHLRNAFLDAVRDVAEHGLVDQSHALYLSFETQYPGVRIPESVRAEHPRICTLVLQHQFENLFVDADGISVVLHFGGVPFGVVIPTGALAGIADPSVGFGVTVINPDLFQTAADDF